MSANWPLILLVLLVIAVGLWWLLGRSKSIDTRTGATPEAPKAPEAPAPAPLERAAPPPPAAPQPLASAPAPAAPAPAPAPKAPATPKPATAKPAAKPKPATKTAAAKAPAAPKSAAPPKAAAKPKPAAAAPAKPDDLLLLKGVGPKLAVLLNELGITRFEQIAGWSDADLARIDAQLGTFKGRATRDKWVEQADYLAKGDTAGFEAKFGKL